MTGSKEIYEQAERSIQSNRKYLETLREKRQLLDAEIKIVMRRINDAKRAQFLQETGFFDAE